MNSETNLKARREYWAESMEQAYGFMQKMQASPVVECGEKLVSMVDAAQGAGVEVTFSQRPHVEGLPRLFYLREGLIGDFLAIAEKMNSLGWVLHVEDAFRNRQMQRGLGLAENTFGIILDRVRWELDGQQPDAELMFRRCTALIATCPKIGTHMSGSAIDISVFSRSDGKEISRGKPYLEMSELTPMRSPFVDEQGRKNRDKITSVMEEHGFMAYPFEFWHYSKGDAYAAYLGNDDAAVAKYGPVDLDMQTGKTTPIESPEKPLITLAEIQQKIEKAIQG